MLSCLTYATYVKNGQGYLLFCWLAQGLPGPRSFPTAALE